MCHLLRVLITPCEDERADLFATLSMLFPSILYDFIFLPLCALNLPHLVIVVFPESFFLLSSMGSKVYDDWFVPYRLFAAKRRHAKRRKDEKRHAKRRKDDNKFSFFRMASFRLALFRLFATKACQAKRQKDAMQNDEKTPREKTK